MIVASDMLFGFNHKLGSGQGRESVQRLLELNRQRGGKIRMLKDARGAWLRHPRGTTRAWC